MYVSDWSMLGRDPELYIEKLENLLKKTGLDDTRVENVFFNNAVGCLGLKQGEKTRTRLEQYFQEHGLGVQCFSIFD